MLLRSLAEFEDIVERAKRWQDLLTGHAQVAMDVGSTECRLGP